MANTRLDKKLIKKIEDKGIKNVNVKVSQKATQLGISSEAALILIAKGLGIGTNVNQRKLNPVQQSEVKDNILTVYTKQTKTISVKSANSKTHTKKIKPTGRTVLIAAIDYLILDSTLKQRCKDLIMADKNFDRAVNQATLVLEDRIRQKSQPPTPMIGVQLVNFAVNSNLAISVLQLSTIASEQEGFANILRGIVGANRNPTHHHIVPYSRDDALKVCAYIDFLLRIIDNSIKIH